MTTLTSTAAKLDKLAGEFSGAAARKRLANVARKSAPDVEAAVRGDIGDTSMSGWRRSGPIPIKGQVLAGFDVAVIPTIRSAGPMRVLEVGRNQGGAVGMHGPGVSSDGTTKRTKSGKVGRVRARRAKRWNGYSSGKGTWSAAEKRIRDAYPARMADEVDDAMAKFFMRG